MKKTGTPGNLTWRIETDNAGEPSGSLVDANATGTISNSDVDTDYDYVHDDASGIFSLDANTRYWLVFYQGATADASNYYSFAVPTNSTYPRGRAIYSNNSGGTWQEFSNKTDIGFRILYGGTQATVVNFGHTVDYVKKYL